MPLRNFEITLALRFLCSSVGKKVAAYNSAAIVIVKAGGFISFIGFISVRKWLITGHTINKITGMITSISNKANKL